MDNYEVDWMKKVKNWCITIGPISEAAEEKYHCEHNVPKKFAYIWQNSILQTEIELETISLNDANLMHSFSHIEHFKDTKARN